jgi:hypothetical protein
MLILMLIVFIIILVVSSMDYDEYKKFMDNED